MRDINLEHRTFIPVFGRHPTHLHEFIIEYRLKYYTIFPL